MMIPFLLLFKQIVPGIILLTVQQVLGLQIHPFFLMFDVLYIYILLLLYFNKDQMEWVFISAFILASIQEYNSGQIIGITALFFLLYSFYYSRISNLFSHGFFLISHAIFSYVLWIAFEVLMHFILSIDSPPYFFTLTQLIRFVNNVVLLVLFYFFLKFFFSRKVTELA